MSTLDHRAAASVRLAVPLVRQPNRWLEKGQGFPCVLLGIVIFLEVLFIVTRIWHFGLPL